jgi:PKD domain
LVGLLTASLVACWTALATADTSAPLVTATVYQPGATTSDSVSLAALQSHPGECPQYSGQSMNELGRRGWTTVPLAPNGDQTGTWTLATILQCMQTPIELGHVTGVTVIDGSGSPEAGTDSQLTRADLSTPSDFNNGAQSPVIQDLGSSTQYDRPWRGTVNRQPDRNYLDEVQGSQNGQLAPIAIEVFEGPLLHVTATASRTTVRAGGTISFSATVSPPNQSGLAYHWNFGGGAANTDQPAPDVHLRSAGIYTVTLDVTDAAGGGGGAIIPIKVTPDSSPAANPKGPKTGPTKSSGHTPGGQAGKSTNGNGNATANAGNGNGNGNGSGSGGSGGATAASNTSATGAADNSASVINAGQTAAHSPHSAGHRPKPEAGRPQANPAIAAQAPRVHGLLISDVTTLPLNASQFAQQRPGRPAVASPIRTAGGRSPWATVLAGALVPLLLGLGAARELRGRGGWRPIGSRS